MVSRAPGRVASGDLRAEALRLSRWGCAAALHGAARELCESRVDGQRLPRRFGGAVGAMPAQRFASAAFSKRMVDTRWRRWRNAIWTRRCNCWPTGRNTLPARAGRRLRCGATGRMTCCAAPARGRTRRNWARCFRRSLDFRARACARGRPLRCDDAERDPRVNREVCRQLGIASVVVMPVVNDDEVLGVFELFSGQGECVRRARFVGGAAAERDGGDRGEAGAGGGERAGAAEMPEMVAPEIEIHAAEPEFCRTQAPDQDPGARVQAV